MSGIIIKELKIVGENKDPASVKFSKGLNIISGPSDTGKSFIFECISFMLGSSQKPKFFKEREGYTKAYLEIDTNNTIFTFERMLDGGDIKLYNGEIEEISKLIPITLNETHQAGEVDNISGFLLDKSGFLIPSWIKKNQHNKKESLSFRHLKNYITVDEVRVITQESPIHSGQYIDVTLEKSIFKLLITGDDDSNLEEKDKPEIKKAKIMAKLDMLDELITDTKEELKKKNNITNVDTVEKEIDSFKNVLDNINAEIDELNSKRNKLWSQIKQKESVIIHSNELIKRFNLLEEQYQADISRLEFIEEGSHYFYQLNTVICPQCGRDVNSDKCKDKFEPIGIENLHESCAAEINKIQLNLLDLKISKNNLTQDVIELEKEIELLRQTKEEFEKTIETNLQPRSLKVRTKLDLLLENYQIKLEINTLKNKLNDLLSKYENIEKSMKNTKKVEKENPLEIEEIVNDSEFTNFLYSTLSNWGFEDLKESSELVFRIQGKERKIDFEITGKERKSYGKGYRGLIYSAFVIGLMRYCFQKKLAHPGFIVIDSPVTTFKDKLQKITIENDEAIPLDKQNAFFNDLAQNYNNRQIIIFENKEPLGNIKEQINYIEFTKDRNQGRYGFFKPLN
ncbi:AAA family ATPase [Terrilactibacillus sp. BCM23-1]|uniref:AAA family ATPase n=1 Tax=Terrilactibacillus tamarindi TaxID=2599694 RepID=A0A6N8CPJ7_9BACI|nr:AAA family ATPase [Terrilactibacillus tamarindi]MTT32052.1 AAA family ATPase [Terrilactibacillus tamarindi]